MNENLWIGALLSMIGGAMQGAFALPMKYARNWQHENIWLVFVIGGFVVLPWVVTVSSIPHWLQIYRSVSIELIFVLIICGAAWGIGVVLVGIAFRVLGIGLSFAIILGLSSLLGSLVPFLFQSRQTIWSKQGFLYLSSTAIMLAGVAIVSAAGSIRDRDKAALTPEVQTKGRFIAGFAVAISAGILSSLLGIGIAFAQPAVDIALRTGTDPVWAPNIVLAPLTTGGALANVVYCVYKLRSNKTGPLFFAESTGSYWIFGFLMAAFWYGGLMLYGLGEQRVGTVAGWPLFIGSMILSSNAAGFFNGEWKGAGRRSKVYLCIGGLVIFAALLLTEIAQNS